MSDIDDWPENKAADPHCNICLGDGLQADGETPCPCIRERAARHGPRHHYRVGYAAGRAAAVNGMTVAEAARVILAQPKQPTGPVAGAFRCACGFLDDEGEVGAIITNEIIETFLRILAEDER